MLKLRWSVLKEWILFCAFRTLLIRMREYIEKMHKIKLIPTIRGADL